MCGFDAYAYHRHHDEAIWTYEGLSFKVVQYTFEKCKNNGFEQEILDYYRVL